MTDAVVPARLKNVQKADEVALQVGIRIGDAIAHTGLCCKVDHLLKLFLLEECIEGGLISPEISGITILLSLISSRRPEA